MEIGLLWFDDDKKRDLPAKVIRAANHYKQRFGRKPELCFVNPSMLGDDEEKIKPGGVILQSSSTVLMNHFWLGMND